jgi:hypothetical protein
MHTLVISLGAPPQSLMATSWHVPCVGPTQMRANAFALSALLALTAALPARAAPAAPAAHVVSNPALDVGKTVSVSQPGAAPHTFRIEKPLGSGYWSNAFQGTDTATGLPVAIKLIRAEHGTIQDSFDKETDVLMKANDEHLQHAYGVGTTPDGRRAMVVQFVEGSALGGAGGDGPAQPAGKAVQIGMQVLRGARALERVGFRHNDIHPGNVVARDFDPSTVKLIDVGNATPVSAGSHGGNPFFNAPEHGGANDDVYSAGALTIRLLTGKASRAALPLIADRSLREILRKMTHPDPAQRFQTTQEAIDALRPYQNGATIEVANRRDGLSTYYGEESVALANLGGFAGGADGRSVEGHAQWAKVQSPEALHAELIRKLDEQMRPGRALSNQDAFARHYADLAMRTNATGAVDGSKPGESLDWNAHYNWARNAPRQAVHDEIVRRTDRLVKALSVP